MTEELKLIMGSIAVLEVWLALVILSLGLLVRDFLTSNSHIGSMMKAVWLLTVMYSGPLGLALYYYAGRKEIARDSIWRKGVRSVSHCYSGCGAGEVTGVLIASGIFSMTRMGITILTFVLAYLFGFGMTLGPQLQAGVPFRQALIDTVYSDTLTIAVMEAVAISIDLWLSANAVITQPIFWSSLVLSLTVGLAAAYPVNVWLVARGVKAGMGDPRNTESATHVHSH